MRDPYIYPSLLPFTAALRFYPSHDPNKHCSVFTSTHTYTLPATRTSNTMTHTYKFNVAMSCGGCSGAIERVLKKLEGEHSCALCHVAY